MQCNGITLHVHTQGDTSAPPLLLLHGNGEDHTIFDAAMPALAQRYFVIAPDSRGHGASQAVERYRYADMAQDMAELLRTLDARNATVFGFSDGGIVALLLAMKEPSRLSRVIAAGANAHPAGVTPACWWETLGGYLRTRDGKLRMMLTQPHITGRALSRIRVPALILCGEHDVIRAAHTRRLALLIPGARMRVLQGEDHGSYIIGSDRFIQAAEL